MINSVAKALHILTELSNGENEPVTVKKLSETLNINRTTCQHIIKTLENNGYAERVSHHDGYILGPEAYFLSRFGKYAESTISICRPVLRWLYRESGYPVILSTIKNDKKFIIEYFDDEHKVFGNKENIRYDDIYRTATGRAILANMNSDEIQNIFKKYAIPEKNMWPEVTSYESLIHELSKIGKNGIVVTAHKANENDYLSVGYGCAIHKRGNCIGAVGIAVTVLEQEYKFFLENENKLRKLLQKAVTEISRRLNYT